MPTSATTARSSPRVRSFARRDRHPPAPASGRGYATGLVGKWGLRLPRVGGEPLAQGFDSLLRLQLSAQGPQPLSARARRNRERLPLAGSDGAPAGRRTRRTFSRRRPSTSYGRIARGRSSSSTRHDPFTSASRCRRIRWPSTPVSGPRRLGRSAGYSRRAVRGRPTRPWSPDSHRSVGRVMDLLEELGSRTTRSSSSRATTAPTYDVGGYDHGLLPRGGGLRSHKGYLYGGRHPGCRSSSAGRRRSRRSGDRRAPSRSRTPADPAHADGPAGAVPPTPRHRAPVSPSREDPRAGRKRPFYMSSPLTAATSWPPRRMKAPPDLLKDPDPVELYDLDRDPGESDGRRGSPRTPDMVEGSGGS